jgi:methylenetetrahydrofolate reductase (NADPH)
MVKEKIKLKFKFGTTNNSEASKMQSSISNLIKRFSIEVMPKTAEKIDDFTSILPKETYVYVAHLEGTPISSMINTAGRLKELQFNVVPHFPARLIQNRNMLEDWIKKYADIGVTKGLILAGSPTSPIGEFKSSMDLLDTGLFDKYQFSEIFCAGHPEGNKDIDISGSDENLINAIKWKQDFAERTQIKLALTTQFCFDIAPIKAWETRLREENINLPINIGVAGPAKLQTMIKFALLCGVGPSIRVLEKRAKDLTKLILPYSPQQFLIDLSNYKKENLKSNIDSVHFFPLGGIKKTTEFLLDKKIS